MGCFHKATNTLAGKALRAMNSLLSITKSMKIPTKIMFSLFDSFVVSILNYFGGFQMQRISKEYSANFVNGT